MWFLVVTLLAAVPEPERCLVTTKNAASVIATYGVKSYRLANDACVEQFNSDPERYSQLYDALIELAAEGAPLTAPAPSLVPS